MGDGVHLLNRMHVCAQLFCSIAGHESSPLANGLVYIVIHQTPSLACTHSVPPSEGSGNIQYLDPLKLFQKQG